MLASLAQRRTYVKGNVIDARHELYTLSIAMMLGLRSAIFDLEGTPVPAHKIDDPSARAYSSPRSHSVPHNFRVPSSPRHPSLISPPPAPPTPAPAPVDTTPSIEALMVSGKDKGVQFMRSAVNVIAMKKQPPPSHPPYLPSEAYLNSDEIMYPPRGSKTTPPHTLSHTFKFKTYCGAAFSKLRSIFKVSSAEFLQSICGNSNFIEFVSNAQSGQFFFYSHDGRFMIKTMSKEEGKVSAHQSGRAYVRLSTRGGSGVSPDNR